METKTLFLLRLTKKLFCPSICLFCNNNRKHNTFYLCSFSVLNSVRLYLLSNQLINKINLSSEILYYWTNSSSSSFVCALVYPSPRTRPPLFYIIEQILGLWIFSKLDHQTYYQIFVRRTIICLDIEKPLPIIPSVEKVRNFLWIFRKSWIVP